MKKVPKYALHKASGLARVRINGKSIYLGKHGSPESEAEYERLIADYLRSEDKDVRQKVTVARLCVMYLQHAVKHYRKNGLVTSEVAAIRCALRPLVSAYSKLAISDFGPKRLEAVQHAMISNGTARKSINIHIGRIRRMFKWAVKEEFVPPAIFDALKAVDGLRKGRSAAVEPAPVRPVSQPNIDAIQCHVSRQVWAMVQLQLLSGMRPGEVRIMRTTDLDRSGSVWEYVPASHKTEHHDRQRRIFFGSKAQLILTPFLNADPDRYLFSPADAREEYDSSRRANRKSPMTPSQRARQRKGSPIRKPGSFYANTSYARAIRNACVKANVAVWTPNQLRHNAATELRKEHGIETVRTILGHANAATSEIYAELDYEKARQVMEQAG